MATRREVIVYLLLLCVGLDLAASDRVEKKRDYHLREKFKEKDYKKNDNSHVREKRSFFHDVGDFFEDIGEEVADFVVDIFEKSVDGGEDAIDEVKDSVEHVIEETKKAAIVVKNGLEAEYSEVKRRFGELAEIVDDNFDVVVAKMIHLIDSRATHLACEVGCNAASTALLPSVPVVPDAACQYICKGALILLEELALSLVDNDQLDLTKPEVKPTPQTCICPA